jgi:Domain of unknown function (DUF4494)
MNYTVAVKVKFEDDKGKVKTKTERYLVDAMSVTEAETRVVKFMEGTMADFEISSASQSRIVEVIHPATTPDVYGK